MFVPFHRHPSSCPHALDSVCPEGPCELGSRAQGCRHVHITGEHPAEQDSAVQASKPREKMNDRRLTLGKSTQGGRFGAHAIEQSSWPSPASGGILG